MLAAGAPVPSSCTPGMRGACKFSLLGGTGDEPRRRD
ncbi:hypothetical protein [Paeniglutamicibacter sulfureus]